MILRFILIALTTLPLPIFASAWLPEAGRYKCIFSRQIVDRASKKQQLKRSSLYISLGGYIYQLEQRLRDLKPTSARHAQLSYRIKSLKALQRDLSSYQDRHMSSLYIEHGVNEKESIGVKILYKEHAFSTKRYHTKSADIFYKLKIKQTRNHIISLQHKAIINNGHRYEDKHTLQEITLFFGNSDKKKNKIFFNEFAASIGYGFGKYGRKKRYYGFSATEGVKFPSGIMLTSFTEYKLRKNYDLPYTKTVYEQIAIAATVDINKKNRNYITLQLGYFWDTNLRSKLYKSAPTISGPILSVWTEI